MIKMDRKVGLRLRDKEITMNRKVRLRLRDKDGARSRDYNERQRARERGGCLKFLAKVRLYYS